MSSWLDCKDDELFCTDVHDKKSTNMLSLTGTCQNVDSVFT